MNDNLINNNDPEMEIINSEESETETTPAFAGDDPEPAEEKQPLYKKIASHFNFSTKNEIISAVIPGMLIILLIRFAELFLNDTAEGHAPGLLLYITMILISLLICPVLLMKTPQVSGRISKILNTGAFFLAPVGTLCMSEALNGVFIYDYSPAVFAVNYLLFLFIQAVFLLITANFKLAVIISDILIFIFTTAAWLILEFRGTPLVPVDILSIKTGLGVASGYHFSFSYTFICGLILFIGIIAVIYRLPRAEFKWRGHTLIRVASLAYIFVLAFTLYGTDTAANNGFKPDFWNQVRGYHRTGTVLNFVLNTKYLFVSEPDGYDEDEIPGIVSDTIAAGNGKGILENSMLMREANLAAAAAEETAQETEEGALIPADTAESANASETQALPNTSADTPVAVSCTSTTAQPRASAKLKSGQVPDVIVIMNETLADLRVLGGFETNQDYFPFLRNLTNNTIKGNLYMPVNGAGTSNSEFEFLTGNSMAFLTSGSNAYELYVKNKLPSIAWTLADRNFFTEALHPYYKASWNRDVNYPLLGISRFTALEDIVDNDVLQSYRNGDTTFYDYEAAVTAQYNGQNVLLRRFVSDSFDYKLLEHDFEARDKSRPYFMLNVTMQNHGGYDVSYSNFQQQIRVVSDNEKYYPATNRFLSLMYESDKALQELVEYFSKVKTPTIVVVFGDHHPSIETEFVEELMGKKISDLTTEEKQRRYVTPFVIWANYDIPEGYVDKMSSNYLSTLLLQTAGIQGTKYNDYLNAIFQYLPVIDTTGYISADDKYYTFDEKSEYDELLNGYKKVQYNNIFDSLGRVEDIFYAGGQDESTEQ